MLVNLTEFLILSIELVFKQETSLKSSLEKLTVTDVHANLTEFQLIIKS